MSRFSPAINTSLQRVLRITAYLSPAMIRWARPTRLSAVAVRRPRHSVLTAKLVPASVIQPDGKTIVSGEVIGVSACSTLLPGLIPTVLSMAALAAEGGRVFDVQTMDIYSIAHATVGLQSSGKVVIAGDSFGTLAGYPANTNPAVLARFTASGAVDSGKERLWHNRIGQQGSWLQPGHLWRRFQRFNDLVVQPDDKIVVVGQSKAAVVSSSHVTMRTAHWIPALMEAATPPFFLLVR